MPYPMDGIVINLADEVYSRSLGNTAHHPRGQIAFKFSGVRRQSKLRNVVWSFGKNSLTPVAEIEPVEISGTTIRHVTLHNLQNVLEKDLMIGDLVTVERAGDVIPHIVSSEPGEERHSCLITECPSCGRELVRDLPELRCVNPDCPETRVMRLLAAVRNIGIERLGEPNIRKMMGILKVRDLNDIFKLKVTDIMKLEGFQAVSANNLYHEIQAARTVPDWQVLASLNIKGIGPNIAKSILQNHTLAELETLDSAELSKIDGIGPERASAIEQELKIQKELIDGLLSCVTVVETKHAGGGKKPTVCFTGKMPEKRSYYEKLALANGMEPADSVTSSLSLLVTADEDSNSTKAKKAASLGVRVLNLKDWLSSLQNPPASSASEAKDDLFLGF